MNCQNCGAEAHLENGELKKTCQCDSPVVVNMESEIEGKGGVKM